MTPAILLALTVSHLSAQPDFVIVRAPAPATTTIALCAQADAHGKVVAARLMRSSGSAQLDESARNVVLGQSIMDEETAAKHPGLWLPMAVATSDQPGPVVVFSCSADSLSR